MSAGDRAAGRPVRTAEIARAAGVHPNTVRRYEALGWIPPAERAANGYRRFSQRHLDCLRLARLIVGRAYPSLAFRRSALRIIPEAVAGDWAAALARGQAHLAFTHAEQAHAEQAAALLQTWAEGGDVSPVGPSVRIGCAARLLGVSIDVLRNWERNGLINVPREQENRYRAYTPTDISRLRIIRLLSQAGYSQMAILRMLLRLDRGERANLRAALDTPAPDEDVYTAADRWLSALADEEAAARALIASIEGVMSNQPSGSPSSRSKPSHRPTRVLD